MAVHFLFVPGANANGAGYASFTFQVTDDRRRRQRQQQHSTHTQHLHFQRHSDERRARPSLSLVRRCGEPGSRGGPGAARRRLERDRSATSTASTSTAGTPDGASRRRAPWRTEDQLVDQRRSAASPTATTVSVGGVEIATYSGGGAGGATWSSLSTPTPPRRRSRRLMRAIALRQHRRRQAGHAGVRTIELGVQRR